MAEKDQQLVETIVKHIVGYPDDVKVDRIVDERGVLLTLHVNAADVGYVIGKQGQTAKAIRTIAKAVGAKNDARVNLKIEEPEGSRGPKHLRREEPSAEANTDVIDDLTI